MAKNLVQCLSHVQGVKVAVSDPATPTSGHPCRVGDKVGIALGPEDSDGNTVVNFTPNVWRVPVSAAAAVGVGDLLYYDNGDDELNDSSSGNKIAGIAMETVAASADGVMTDVMFGVVGAAA